MRSRSGRADLGADGCPDSESSQTWQTSRTATEKKSVTSLGRRSEHAGSCARSLTRQRTPGDDPGEPKDDAADAQTAATPAASLARQRILPGESDAQTAANADGGADAADGGAQIRRTTADGAQIQRMAADGAQDGAQTADEAD